MILQQLHRRHDHPRRAEAALQPVAVPESLLHRMQIPVRCQPLDRSDGGAVGLHREYRARLDRLAVHQHRAGAANAGLAADVGAGQSKAIAQVVNQQETRFDVMLARRVVDGESKGNRQGGLPREDGPQSYSTLRSKRYMEFPARHVVALGRLRRSGLMSPIDWTWGNRVSRASPLDGDANIRPRREMPSVGRFRTVRG